MDSEWVRYTAQLLASGGEARSTKMRRNEMEEAAANPDSFMRGVYWFLLYAQPGDVYTSADDTWQYVKLAEPEMQRFIRCYRYGHEAIDCAYPNQSDLSFGPIGHHVVSDVVWSFFRDRYRDIGASISIKASADGPSITYEVIEKEIPTS